MASSIQCHSVSAGGRCSSRSRQQRKQPRPFTAVRPPRLNCVRAVAGEARSANRTQWTRREQPLVAPEPAGPAAPLSASSSELVGTETFQQQSSHRRCLTTPIPVPSGVAVCSGPPAGVFRHRPHHLQQFAQGAGRLQAAAYRSTSFPGLNWLWPWRPRQGGAGQCEQQPLASATAGAP